MKKVILSSSFLLILFFTEAQIGGLLNKATQQATSKVNNKANSTADKSKDDPTNKKTGEVKPNSENSTPGSNVKDTTPVPEGSSSIKSYSKYDFIPGEKVIGFEDFSTGNIGDFPAGWNTSSSAEIVTIDGKQGRWLMLTKAGVFVPEFTDKYPDDFTFEFDLLHGVPITGADFHITLAQLDDINKPQFSSLATNRVLFELNNATTGTTTGVTRSELRKNTVSEAGNQTYTELLNDKNNPVHISIWRQKERVRLYINEEKVWDIPKGLAKESKLNAIVFSVGYVEAKTQHYIGNIRLAIGAPDTRNKMLTQNKWVTHGILFDVNSANIKPESYGTLKEIANVLKENPDLKVKIVGHTDSDGNDAANLDLSKRRAASVKASLAKEFGIDENRMETDGKGESEPIDKNDSPAGKANNRRVEFIKI